MKKSNIAIACAFLFALSVSTSFASPASNEQILINSTAAKVESSFSEVMTGGLSIVTDTTGLGGLISAGIAEGLKGRYDTILLAAGPVTIGPNLYFDLLGFNLDYKKGASRGFLRGRKIRREMLCELRINIRDGGLLRDARNVTVYYNDEIERADIRFVNSRDIPALAPEPPGSSWSRYAEPALVVGSVGALVYLFFANR